MHERWAQLVTNNVKKFLILHYGFEKPSAEDMAAWNQWFESIADRQVEKGHLPRGREFSRSGARQLAMAQDSLTGYTIISAEDLEEAAQIAEQCPIVSSTQVYEIMGH